MIRAQLAEREWLPGGQIPSESALAATHEVSVVTVRQALTVLVDEGLLQRFQGRGTFVANDSPMASEVRLTVPLERILDSVADSTVEPIDIQLVRGPLAVFATLGVDPDEQIVRVRRVRSSQSKPISYAISYLPRWLGEEIRFEDLREQWLVALLERKFKVTFRQAIQTIEATVADPESASLLHLAVGSPLLLVHRDYQLDDGRIAYVAVNRYPSHLYRYRMLLVRQGPNVRDWELSPVGAAKQT